MRLIRLYIRVLGQLAPNAWLAWTLSAANIALATTQFAEPILFGRVVDTLGIAHTAGGTSIWPRLLLLLAAWAGFGLFNILCGTLVAFYADRLSHCRRHAVLSAYFEHVLQLPLPVHTGSTNARTSSSRTYFRRKRSGPSRRCWRTICFGFCARS
jgi:ATP-binding cassette, subfamily B, beta-glucan exporter